MVYIYIYIYNLCKSAKFALKEKFWKDKICNIKEILKDKIVMKEIKENKIKFYMK